ncbi:MAG: TetR/AcrR family transcriptional regulator [Nocardiopsaceae bacterium]|nr:TetR/AcrR family transcriptional regulator [Nocardiopsaceae bacterium]
MPAPRPGKSERLVAAACDLVYRKGVARTTLADIASGSGVLVGNLYYYFKAKDDIVAAIAHAHAHQLRSGLAELERRHRSPRARLKALVGVLADRREMIARYGCRYGTLGSELAKQAEGADPLAALLMRIPLDWAEQQFRAMGRRDAHDLAVELVATYQGSALLANALGQPELMARQARRLEHWIDTLASSPGPPGRPAGEKG